MWYKTGTINLIANNATVTGTGTAWADAKFGVMPGMILLAPDNKLYEVKQVNSNTSLTLNSNYAGSTASGQSYAIITTYEGDISQFSARFAAMLTFFQGSRNDTVSWFTGSGDMTFTKDDGTKLTVPTLAKIQADYLSKTTTADQSIAGPVLFTKASTFNNGSTSLGDNVFQAKTAGANVILRYKDMDGVEQGAIYVTSATGQMTQRWGGTAFSAVYKNDGTVTFPSNVYVGNARLLSEATQLGTQDLNTVVDEKRYFQNSTANATLARNYPVAVAGTLEVINSHAQASGRTGVTQNYYVWNIVGYYYTRTYFALSDTWSEWDIYEARAKSDARYLQIGAYGLGTDYRASLTGYTLASDYRINGAFYGNVSSMTDTFDAANNHIFNVFGYANRTYGFQMAFPFGADKMAFRRIQNNGVGAWKEVWHNGNLVNPLQAGSYGLGSTQQNSSNNIDLDSSRAVGFYAGSGFTSTTGMPSGWPTGTVHAYLVVENLAVSYGTTCKQTLTSHPGSTFTPKTWFRVQRTGVWGPWQLIWDSANTTVDTNGFIKSASPIVKLYGDGISNLNDESQGVTTERIDLGVYEVKGSLGFALEGWNIEVPQDVNGNRLCFVATEAAEDGTITVKVSKRRFDIDTAAIVAGEPMDIPEGRWIDLRLEMPPVEEVQSEPEPESHEGEMASE
ncbi:pyocin knob domain-containing protein [Serratia fonticola]